MIDCKRSSSPRGSLLTAAAALQLAVLAGCATPVASDLTVFHQWPAEAPRSYRFATSESQLASLEHASYRSLMRQELARVGFTESTTPRFEVRFDYSTDPRVGRLVEYASPYYFQPWFGVGSWGSHGGVSFMGPWPGWGAPYAVERQQTWYGYRLELVITDLAQAGKRVFEATAVTGGTTESIAPAMPYLARSVFADFPGLSGLTRRVEVPENAVQRLSAHEDEPTRAAPAAR
jgi:hypothetical protein